jgi:hypothetical protein
MLIPADPALMTERYRQFRLGLALKGTIKTLLLLRAVDR